MLYDSLTNQLLDNISIYRWVCGRERGNVFENITPYRRPDLNRAG